MNGQQIVSYLICCCICTVRDGNRCLWDFSASWARMTCLAFCYHAVRGRHHLLLCLTQQNVSSGPVCQITFDGLLETVISTETGQIELTVYLMHGLTLFPLVPEYSSKGLQFYSLSP